MIYKFHQDEKIYILNKKKIVLGNHDFNFCNK